MDADFSIELGREDPVLDFPWTDPSGAFAYRDLKRHPELIAEVEEARKFPELGEFLRVVNSAASTLETAKCGVWATTELNAEEEIYDASHKFAGYVDVLFTEMESRLSFPAHERYVRTLVDLLRRAPEIPSSSEVCVRRCYFGEVGIVENGFYCTLYVNGYGNDDVNARQNWSAGLKSIGNAIVQMSVG
jgi:hypothetical protein